MVSVAATQVCHYSTKADESGCATTELVYQSMALIFWTLQLSDSVWNTDWGDKEAGKAGKVV